MYVSKDQSYVPENCCDNLLGQDQYTNVFQLVNKMSDMLTSLGSALKLLIRIFVSCAYDIHDSHDSHAFQVRSNIFLTGFDEPTAKPF